MSRIDVLTKIDTENNFPINFNPMPKRFMVWDREGQEFIKDGKIFEGFWAVAMIADHSPTDNKRYMVIQSTNLLDKDGKEIFEGSILHGAMSRWLVRQLNGCWVAQNISIKNKFGDDYFMLLKNIPEKSLLGHILSNPELLEGVKC